MADDDEAPRYRRPGSHWPDERRATVGAKHRAHTSPRGVVSMPVIDDHTPVYDQVDAPLTHGEAQQLISWVSRRIDKRIDDTGDSGEVTEIKAKVDQLERDVEPLRALRKWLWTSSIATVLALVAFFWSRGDVEGEQRQRLRQVEQFVDELRRDERELERAINRHSSVTPAIPPDAISSAQEGLQP